MDQSDITLPINRILNYHTREGKRSVVPPQFALEVITCVFTHKLTLEADGVFHKIGDLMSGKHSESYHLVQIPKRKTDFYVGIGVNTWVHVHEVCSQSNGPSVSTENGSTPSIPSNTRFTSLLLIKPRDPGDRPLRWAQWDVAYKRVPRNISKEQKRNAKAPWRRVVTESVVYTIDEKAVLSWFKKEPDLLHRFLLISHNIESHARHLNDQAYKMAIHAQWTKDLAQSIG